MVEIPTQSASDFEPNSVSPTTSCFDFAVLIEVLAGIGFLLLALLFRTRNPGECAGRIQFESRHASIVKREVMIIYTSCREQTVFPVWKTNISLFHLKCNPETSSVDCNEAVPMLNFLIDHYDNPLAAKHIFLHAHETAWHYFRPVFDQIRDVIALDYFRNNE
jgi:hypothetical protein